jgi:NADH-quinone oxidoreductase subunit L
VYTLGLISALLTAIYMTRMMLYTFHGPTRTGEAEQSHLAEAPWIMTGPLVVLGLLSAGAGWFNLPAILPLGRVEVLEKWLEPVVGEATNRVMGSETHLAVQSEQILIGVAIAIAITGIIIAVTRLKPAALVAKKDSPESTGIEKVLEHKYYVDEGYDAVVVTPVVARGLGWMGSQLQSGQVGTYAWVLLIGVIALLGAFTKYH